MWLADHIKHLVLVSVSHLISFSFSIRISKFWHKVLLPVVKDLTPVLARGAGATSAGKAGGCRRTPLYSPHLRLSLKASSLWFCLLLSISAGTKLFLETWWFIFSACTFWILNLSVIYIDSNPSPIEVWELSLQQERLSGPLQFL